MKARTSIAGRSDLKSKVLPSHTGAHQTWVTRLQEWLTAHHMEDYDPKKQLASKFVRSYPSNVHSLVTDNQERNSSARSRSVQIVTVHGQTLYLNEHGSDLSGRLHMNEDHMENYDLKKQLASRFVQSYPSKGPGKGGSRRTRMGRQDHGPGARD